MRKQILSLAVALLIGSTVCMAQNRQNGKADREKRMEQIVADLGLNEKQAKDFKAAMEEMRPAKNKSNERPTREEMQKKRQEIDAKIKSIPVFNLGAQASSIRVPRRIAFSLRAASLYSGRGIWKKARAGRGCPPFCTL